MTLHGQPWLEPRGSAQTSSHSGQGSVESCALGAIPEPALETLTSFQSLPFVNIYSSSSTKNNILEPREEKKRNENYQEFGLIIMCAGAEWTPEEREQAHTPGGHGSACPASSPGSAAKDPLSSHQQKRTWQGLQGTALPAPASCLGCRAVAPNQAES